MSYDITEFTGTHRFLSNFYYAPVMFEGVRYPTVEHAYQAAKSDDLDYRAQIVHAITPGAAKKLGRRAQLRKYWEQEKEIVMFDLLLAKFAPGTDLAKRLLETGDVRLVEGNTWGDEFWGVCRGIGKNRLGEMLMSLREHLRK